MRVWVPLSFRDMQRRSLEENHSGSKMEYIYIAGREVPTNVITDYCNFIRGDVLVKRYGIQGFEWERERLHSRIFLAAGFKPTRWGTPRKTAAFFGTFHCKDLMKEDPDVGYDEDLVIFHDELERFIRKMLLDELKSPRR